MPPLLQRLARIGPSWKTLASAFLIACALPPLDLDFLIWIALVPWLCGLQKLDTYWQSLRQGFWLSFATALLVAHWIAYALHEFLSLAWPLSILGLVVFASLCPQPQFLLFAPLFRWMANGLDPPSYSPSQSQVHALCLCLGLAFGYAGLDYLLPRLFEVGLGYSLHEATNLRQLADVGGVALLTCFIVLINLLVWRAMDLWLRPVSRGSDVLPYAALALSLFGGAYFYGADRNEEVAAHLEGAERMLRVGLAQGNVRNEIRLGWASGDDRAAEKQLSTYMLLTERFVAQTPRPDIVVWPEATFPGIFSKPESRLQRGRQIKFDRQALRLGVPIVFGAYDMTDATDAKGERTFFNSLFSITPNYQKAGSQGLVQVYRKHELLAFAEHIPGVAQGGWIHQRLPSLGFFGRGAGAQVLQIVSADGTSIGVGPVICSEALNAQHVIDGARQGSRLILNVGSDGWFGPYGEPQFHLAISKFRSIETRLPQVRAANTGISALILPNGALAERSELGQEQILNLEVPIGEGPGALMVEWGDWFGRASLIAGIGFVLLLGLASRGPMDGRRSSRRESLRPR